MATTDKNILITPNRGQSADPKIEFSGADASTSAQTITLNVYPTDNGTLSFEGSAGQLFSITNSLSGSIFSVNDVSGVPSIEVLDTGLVKIAQYSGNVLLGTGTDNGTDKLQVNGSVTATVLKSTIATGTAPFTVDSTTVVTNLNADLLDGISSDSLLLSDADDNYTSGTLTFNSGTTLTAANGATVNFNNATGTAPFTVTSTTVVTNLNADLLDGISSGSLLRSDADDNYTSGTLTFNSGTTLTAADGATVNFSNAQGTAPFTVTSSTRVINLNADLLDGISGTALLRSNATDNYTSGTLTFDSGTTLTAADGATVNFSNATGTAPFTVASTTAVTNLNADLLDGNHASAFATSGHTHLYAGSSTAGGAANSVANAVTFNDGGSGAASGTTFDGSVARTISYNTVGAASSGHGHSYYIGTTAVQASSANQGVTGITSITGGTGTTAISFLSANTTSANSGAVTLSSGTTTTSGVTGNVNITTGSSAGVSGNISIHSGAAAGNSASGEINIYTSAASGTGASGDIAIYCGANGASASARAGDIDLVTGPSSNTQSSGYASIVTGINSSGTTSATTGNIYITTGAATSTAAITKTTGSIYIDGGGIGASGTRTFGSIYIGNRANDATTGTTDVVIGKSGTAVKLPGVGTSGFVKLGTGGELSADSTTYLSAATDSTQNGYFGNIYLYDDTNPSHHLAITNSSDLSAERTLSINVNNADRTISLSGNLTVSAAATVSGTNTGDQTSVTGNAGSATILQTARTINGTSFNGSANITTGSWGSSRTITIGSTGKSVDGSANVSWTLTEIMPTSSNVQINSLGVGTTASGTAGEIRATNDITAFYSSDIRLKENVRPIDSALDRACAIGGKYFDWKEDYIKSRGGEDGYFVRKHDFGVIAQDVLKHFPVAVRTKEDNTLAVDYEKLCALAFEAIKELREEVETLKGKM